MYMNKLGAIALLLCLIVMLAVDLQQYHLINTLKINQKILIHKAFKEVPPREEMPFGGVRNPTFRGS
jgi:hypothetical protein